MAKKIILPILVLAIALSLGFFVWWSQSLGAVSPTSNVSKDFLITKGSSATQIATKLQKEGLIKNALIFRVYVIVSGSAKKIQAGEYSLSPSFTIQRIVSEFLSGPREVWVTVPEGLRREEVAERFVVGLGIAEEEKSAFRKEFLSLTKGKEGYLFPDTYLFPKEASASVVTRKMLTTFTQKAGQVDMETLILASLLERETITVGEKPVVAGIILKRARAGWPLQIDAAVQYAVATTKCGNTTVCSDWWPILTREDIEIKSAFNTYRNPGFPPAPIASPGLASINAAKAPEDSSYWYYIHDTKGQIHYATTLEEHNANVRQYLGK